MSCIHFVYRVGVSPAFFHRGPLAAMETRLRTLRPGLLAPSYRKRRLSVDTRPLRAPYSIALNLCRYLRERSPTKLYDIEERGAIRLDKEDVLLGHPWPDPETIVQQTLRKAGPCRCKALIVPVHHGLPDINQYLLPLLDQVDLVFGIMGDYWYDTLEDSFLADLRHKLVRLDMAVATDEYPLIKQRFNPPGQRGYFYIGSDRPEKGVDILDRTMGKLGGPRAGVIGCKSLDNVPAIAEGALLTPTFMQKLAQDYDFFVNTSRSDANPTTILEAMAWGFPVACTPQSGYYKMPSIMELSCTDIDHNVEVLRELQHAPEERLLALSRQNRQRVETHYTWERFCGTVWAHLKQHLRERG